MNELCLTNTKEEKLSTRTFQPTKSHEYLLYIYIYDIKIISKARYYSKFKFYFYKFL